jgi:hypothetical protein
MQQVDATVDVAAHASETGRDDCSARPQTPFAQLALERGKGVPPSGALSAALGRVVSGWAYESTKSVRRRKRGQDSSANAAGFPEPNAPPLI